MEYKSDYNLSDHNVTIQIVNAGDEGAIWIDGYAQPLEALFEAMETDERSVAQKLAGIAQDQFDEGNRAAGLESLATYLVSMDQYVCSKCESLYPADNVVSTHFAGHKCGECATSDNTCEDGGEHEMTCVNPRQKHNARVSTKYRCEKCGYTRKTTPTG